MRTIIVALDGSPFAEAAIPLALGLAQCLKAQIELVSVHQPPSGLRAMSGVRVHDLTLDHEEAAQLRVALQQYLEHVAVRIGCTPDAPPVQVTLLDGEPADRLCQHAIARQAALMIVTTHGRGGLARAWLGSVTDAVLRETGVPLLVVRPPAADHDGAPAASFVSQRVQKVLIALDGSGIGEAVIGPLQALFGNAVEYLVFGAVPPLHPMLRAIASHEEYERDLLAQQAKFAGYLKAAEASLTDRGMQASRCALIDLEPARAIHHCASTNAVDVIAMATHGRGLLGRVMLGSIADKVLRTADAPVLLCRIPPEVA